MHVSSHTCTCTEGYKSIGGRNPSLTHPSRAACNHQRPSNTAPPLLEQVKPSRSPTHPAAEARATRAPAAHATPPSPQQQVPPRPSHALCECAVRFRRRDSIRAPSFPPSARDTRGPLSRGSGRTLSPTSASQAKPCTLGTRCHAADEHHSGRPQARPSRCNVRGSGRDSSTLRCPEP